MPEVLQTASRSGRAPLAAKKAPRRPPPTRNGTSLHVEEAPSFENGDRLTRDDFHRRYEAMPWIKKAELIEGVVHMPAATKRKNHGKPHSDLVGWLWNYSIHTPGTDASDNTTILLDLDNELQPDVFLRVSPASGGQTRDTADDYVEGAPELIVEIASSSASYDLHSKKNAYRRNGVREYLVWLTQEQRIEWWRLDGSAYVPLAADKHGVVKSTVFPGLWLDVPSLLKDEMRAVLAKLQAGIASREASSFRKSLATRRKA